MTERGKTTAGSFPLFADLQADHPQKNDEVQDIGNMSLREEPECIIN